MGPLASFHNKIFNFPKDNSNFMHMLLTSEQNLVYKLKYFKD